MKSRPSTIAGPILQQTTEASLRTPLDRRWRYRTSAGPVALLLSLIAVSALPRSSVASSVITPPRPLSYEERFSQSIGSADAICRAEVLRCDRIVWSDKFQGTPIGLAGAYVTLRPIDWFLGQNNRKEIRLGLDADDDVAYRMFEDAAKAHAQAVVFLINAPKKTEALSTSRPWPYPEGIDYLVESDPYSMQGGAVVLSPSSRSSITNAVHTEIARQSLEALTDSSDIILVGHHPPGVRLREQIPGYLSSLLKVDSVILGDLSVGDTIILRSVRPADLPDDSSLVFLRRLADGSFAVVRPAAASCSIKGGRLRKPDIALDEALGRIRARSASDDR